MNTTPALTTAQVALAKAFGVFVVERDDGLGNRYCASVLGIGDCFCIHAKTVLGCKRMLFVALRDAGVDPKTINIGVEGSCELVRGTLCDVPDCGMPATHNDDYDLCDKHYRLFLEEDEEKTETAQ